MVKNGVCRATKNIVEVGLGMILAYDVDAKALALVWWMQKMYGWHDGATRATFNLATEGSITREAAICLMVVLSCGCIFFYCFVLYHSDPKA
jgi:hypothetical protein